MINDVVAELDVERESKIRSADIVYYTEYHE